MKYTTVLILVLCLFGGPISCHKVTKVELIEQLKNAPSYNETLKEWTKSTQHYYFEEVQFFVTVTYKSLPLRMAYLKEYTKKYKISEEEQLNQYNKELGDYKNFNDFFITVFSSKKDINDLKDKSKWRLYLEEGSISGARLLPESIEKVDRDSVLSYFYPQVNPWTSNFIVRFSRTLADATSAGNLGIEFSALKLLIASVVGEQTFAWGVMKGKVTK